MLFYAAALQTLNYDWDTLPLGVSCTAHQSLTEQSSGGEGSIESTRRERT